MTTRRDFLAAGVTAAAAVAAGEVLGAQPASAAGVYESGPG